MIEITMVRSKYIPVIILGLLVIIFSSCNGVQNVTTPEPQPSPQTQPSPEQPQIIKPPTQEESYEIALEFLKKDPTFAFDGIEESIELIGGSGQTYCGIIISFYFEFDCKHPGYGNRTGQNLPEVITHHRAEISTESGKITFAVMDYKWDMIEKKMLDIKEPSQQ